MTLGSVDSVARPVVVPVVVSGDDLRLSWCHRILDRLEPMAPFTVAITLEFDRPPARRRCPVCGTRDLATVHEGGGTLLRCEGCARAWGFVHGVLVERSTAVARVPTQRGPATRGQADAPAPEPTNGPRGPG